MSQNLLQTLTTPSRLTFSVGFIGLLLLLLAIIGLWRRLVSHPLARFRGPRLAAATEWYITYYEVWKDGGLVPKLVDLHKEYGPVVRIGPNELHFNDPRAYTDIHTNGYRFTKDPKLYRTFHEDESSFAYIDPRDAKTRRDILAPMFSRKMVTQLENVVMRKVEALVQRILSYEASSTPVNMHRAYRSATLDVISCYCFAREFNVIDSPEFTHFLVMAYEPHPELLNNEEHETIFNHLLPHPEKGQVNIPSKESLLAEAVNLLGAGSDTVGHACTTGTFWVLHNPIVKDKLFAELKTVWPDKDLAIGSEILEKLPYLPGPDFQTAVIKESLRFSHGLASAAPRVVPSDAIIAGHVVPRGTVVGMGAMFMHQNPELFPDPLEFRPERWLEADARNLDPNLVAFSKGPRNCLGQNLAWSEMYLLFGHVFRRIDMQLHETTLEDMAFRCHIVPIFRGKQLHCTVRSYST